MTKMTNLSPQAQAVLDAFYLTFANERQDFIVQNLNNDALAAVLREVVFQLQYYRCCEYEGAEDMVLDARVILDVADELENL